METIPINFFIQDSPFAIVVVDKKLSVLTYSKKFSEKLIIHKKDFHGERLFDIFYKLPAIFKQQIVGFVNGETYPSDDVRFVLSNGATSWFRCKLQSIGNRRGEATHIMVVFEDVTKDIKYRNLLLKGELVSKTGCWEVDLVHQEVFWSPMTKIIHEVAEDYIPNLEAGINFYKEGPYRELIIELVNKASVNGEPYDVELILVTGKGREIWVRAKGEAEIINGKCIRLFGTFQDIDEEKKRDLEHSKATDRLNLATVAAKVGVWEYNVVENKLLWDDNMHKLYGVKKTDFSGEYEAWQQGLHPDDKKRGDVEIQEALEDKKPFDTEFRVVWPDKTIKHIKAIATVKRDAAGNPLFMIGTNWDITELKSTQLKLARTEEYFLDTFNNATIGMALIGLNGEWISVNKSICKSLGYTPKEFANITTKDITYPKDIELSLALFEKAKAGERESFQLEKRYVHKNGLPVYAIVTATIVRDIHDKIVHFIVQIIDITDRITAEKKLETLVQVTKAQNDSLLNFAHIVSHNLRSHSTNMTMLTKLLIEEKNEDEKVIINKMLVDATASLSETILHLNEVVQVKTDNTKILRSINLLSTTRLIENSIRGLITKENATIEIQIDEKHEVKVVPAYLESILLNLFTNALKYRSPERNPILKIWSEKHEDVIRFAFKDNGLGMNLKKHGDKLFGMYKTFHSHKEAKGIGLFITKNQIESMKGSITVESTKNVGTTFYVTLLKG